MKRMRPGKHAKMLKVPHYLSFLFLKFLNCPVVDACCLFLLSMLFSGDKISVYFILFSCRTRVACRPDLANQNIPLCHTWNQFRGEHVNSWTDKRQPIWGVVMLTLKTMETFHFWENFCPPCRQLLLLQKKARPSHVMKQVFDATIDPAEPEAKQIHEPWTIQWHKQVSEAFMKVA